jgi:signal transduction histidine kinase
MGSHWGSSAYVHPRERIQWTPAQITLLYYLAGFLALFVSDVFLVQQLQEPLLSRVQAVKGGVEVVLTGLLIFVLTRKSRTNLQHTASRLERQREELGVLHRVFRHNMRNRLTVINGRINSLRAVCERDRARSLCDDIDEVLAEIAGYVDRVNQIRRISETGARETTVELGSSLQAAISTYADGPVEIETALPERACVTVNPLFAEAVAELVANAVEHTDASAPRVRVAATRGASTVQLRIADNGSGIPSHVTDGIERGELDQLRHGQGMGLWFAYWVINDAGGEFDIRSNEWGGTTVELTLQRAVCESDAGFATSPQ